MPSTQRLQKMNISCMLDDFNISMMYSKPMRPIIGSNTFDLVKVIGSKDPLSSMKTTACVISLSIFFKSIYYLRYRWKNYKRYSNLNSTCIHFRFTGFIGIFRIYEWEILFRMLFSALIKNRNIDRIVKHHLQIFKDLSIDFNRKKKS